MRRHINEFLKSNLANKGRAAGIGIFYDRYDEESGNKNMNEKCSQLIFPSRTEEEREALDGDVIIYKLR